MWSSRIVTLGTREKSGERKKHEYMMVVNRRARRDMRDAARTYLSMSGALFI